MSLKQIHGLNYTDFVYEKSGIESVVDSSLNATGWISDSNSEMENVSVTESPDLLVATYQCGAFPIDWLDVNNAPDVCEPWRPETTELEQQQTVEELTQKRAYELSTDFMKSGVERQSTDTAENQYYSRLPGLCDESKRRNKSAIDKNTINSIVHLGAVVALVLIVLGVLANSVTAINSVTDLSSGLKFYLPRIGMVSFASCLARFFMSEYRTSLAQNQYLQNESTNIESREIALTAAIGLECHETIQSVITTYAHTDRNKKNESTPFRKHP